MKRRLLPCMLALALPLMAGGCNDSTTTNPASPAAAAPAPAAVVWAPGAVAPAPAAAGTVRIKLTIGGGSGAGTVTLNPPGPDFAPGTTVTLTATADQGSGFGGWTGACTSAAYEMTCTVTVTADTVVNAEFDLGRGPLCHAVSTVTFAPGPDVRATCPTGATSFCSSSVINRYSAAQAKQACEACYGAGACFDIGFGVVATPTPGTFFFYADNLAAPGCGINAGETLNFCNNGTNPPRWAF